MSQTPFISIILPTYNRLPLLKKAIAALQAQQYPADRFEILIVDDGSTDGTAVYLASQTGIRTIRQANRGPSAARNAGVQAAQADLLAFIDDDCQATPGWLAALAESLQDQSIPNLGAVCGPILPAQHTHWLHPFYLFSGRIHPQNSVSGATNVVFSCNMALSRQTLAAVGGFDAAFEHPGGEDLDLSYRLRQAGYRLHLNSEAVVRHRYPASFREMTAHFWHHGLGMAIVFHRWPDLKAQRPFPKWWQQFSQRNSVQKFSARLRPGRLKTTMRPIGCAVWQAIKCVGYSFLFTRQLTHPLRQEWTSSRSIPRLLLYTLLSYYVFAVEQAGLVFGVYTYLRQEKMV
jgi:O-antigen biosynthesis protein